MDTFSFGSMSLVDWLWLVALVLPGTAIGFIGGYFYGMGHMDRALRRAQRSISGSLAWINKTFDTASTVMAQMQHLEDLKVSRHQLSEFEAKRGRLLTLVKQVAEKLTMASPASQITTIRPGSKRRALKWLRDPVDARTQLPARKAFEANLDMLLDLADARSVTGGLLLIKVDRFPQICERYGVEGGSELLKKLASVAIRAGRDNDILCRISDDSFAALLADVDDVTGIAIATEIRNAIRHHHFRIVETGPEVLLTASFGYATLGRHDDRELVMNRAGDALARSQKQGRNWLHAHDGGSLLECAAG